MAAGAAHPLVSVIVPSYNQGEFIGSTLESILTQGHRPLEVLVLDGGSTDRTLDVLEGFSSAPELRVWSEPDEGVVDAVNKGFSRARGEIIGIQSSDDMYVPGAIEAAVDHFARHPETALVYGDVELIDAGSRVIGLDRPDAFDLHRYLARFLYVPQPSAFFRASVIGEVSGWREEVSYVADADFWIRIALGHEVRKIDRLMGRYRYHEGQRDVHRDRIRRDWDGMVRDLLARPDLDRRTRQYVRMGGHLAQMRYKEGSVQRRWHLYRAALANPAGVLDPGFPRRALVPGLAASMRQLSRARRGLGLGWEALRG